MLVYFLANSGERIINQDINLDSQFFIHYDNESKSLKINRNYNYLNGFWGTNISSITAIVGSNGVGKTSILELIKDRFFNGLAHPYKTILIFKENNQYKLFYSEGLFKEENEIAINDITYDINNSTLNNKKNIVIALKELGISIEVIKCPSKDTFTQQEIIGIRTLSRIAKEHTLVYYTNHWNYSIRDRRLDLDANMKKLTYFDYSIGNRIDSIVRHNYKYTPSISNIENIFDISKDSRFEIDYLYQLKEEEISNALNYLSNKSNRELLKKHFTVPEELYIYYDFMNSEKRSSLFSSASLNEEMYLRFEERAKNYKLEKQIYDYLLKETNSRINVKEAILLATIERFFTDADSMVSPKEIKSIIRNLEDKNSIVIKDDKDILKVLENFNNVIIQAIHMAPENEIFSLESKSVLNHRFSELFNSYWEFINFLFEDFIGKVDVTIIETNLFEVTANGQTTKFLEIEIPILKTNEDGLKLANSFLKQYRNIKSHNKFLYFVWRNLSSGENHLLNLLTSLNTAIQESILKNIIILLDEVEISMHPVWQRNFIKLLVENINDKAKLEDKHIQVIATTHSPFLLSDLPLNSLILLEKNLQNKTVIQKGLEDQMLTLGTNIHELFSHSFFLKGGLIGDYAKQKINEVAEKLIKYSPEQKEDIDWEEIRRLINQVGEPIIRTRLVELYDQKFKPKQQLDHEITNLRTEINELTNRLNTLEQKGNTN